MKTKGLNLLFAVCLAVMTSAVPVYADQINVSGSTTMNGASWITAIGIVNYDTTKDTFNGSLQFTNSHAANAFVTTWSLQLFGGNVVVSNFSASGAGWTDFYGNDKQSNNGSPCNTSTNKGWVCADGFTNGATPFVPGVIAGNGSVTYTFSGSFSKDNPVSVLDLMANGCTTTSYYVSTGSNGPTVNCGTKLALSTSSKWTKSAPLNGPVPKTPEPASLALLASGFLGLGLLRRRK